MKILVTGSDGFIAKNLISHLSSEGYKNVIPFNRKNNATELNEIVRDVDFVFHLAAQALVKESYANPALTFDTNIMGTFNLIDISKN